MGSAIMRVHIIGNDEALDSTLLHHIKAQDG
jgi:hypothetical protein